MITLRAGTSECDFWLYWAKHPRTEGVRYAPRTCPQDRACTRGTPLLRRSLSANSDDEERPRASDDDEPLRNAWGFLSACIPRPARAPEPHCVHSGFEFCTRRANVDPSITQHDRSQRTDRVGGVCGDRNSSDRPGSGPKVGGGNLSCDSASQQLRLRRKPVAVIRCMMSVIRIFQHLANDFKSRGRGKRPGI